MRMARRMLLGATLSATAMPRSARPVLLIRIGVLRFGTVSWEIDVIRQHALGAEAQVAIVSVELATPQACQVALQAGHVDMIVVDWLWVARQRAAGDDWSFVPFSNAVGALIAPAGSTVRDVADLAGRALGVAGSPLDKSWLILRAYATQRYGIGLYAGANISFGAPPLLAEQMKAGRLDALLTYWPFAAKAEAAGARRGRCGPCSGDRRRRALYRLYLRATLGGTESCADRWVRSRVASRSHHPGDIGCRVASSETNDGCSG